MNEHDLVACKDHAHLDGQILRAETIAVILSHDDGVVGVTLVPRHPVTGEPPGKIDEDNGTLSFVEMREVAVYRYD